MVKAKFKYTGPLDRIQNEEAEADLMDRKGVNLVRGRSEDPVDKSGSVSQSGRAH